MLRIYIHSVYSCNFMATTALTLRVPEEIKTKLELAMQRPKSLQTQEAIARHIDLEVWQVGEIEQAIQEADRGDFAAHLT